MSPGRQAARLSGLLRALLAPRAAPPGAVVLAYHDVTPDGAASAPYTVSATDLDDHLILLRSLGYQFVDLDALVVARAAGGSLDRLAAITFDDGYAGFAAVAAPVLAAHGAPATVFCCSDLMGEVPWWSTAAVPLADAQEVAALSALPGITIGAHGRHHVALSALDEAGQRDEVRGCRERLEALLGQPVEHFAYPYGSYDERSPRLAAEAGFRASYSFSNGRVSATTPVHLMPRLVMHSGQRGLRLRYTLSRSNASFSGEQTDVVHATGLANSFPPHANVPDRP